jgi:hypothetical protein
LQRQSARQSVLTALLRKETQVSGDGEDAKQGQERQARFAPQVNKKKCLPAKYLSMTMTCQSCKTPNSF